MDLKIKKEVEEFEINKEINISKVIFNVILVIVAFFIFKWLFKNDVNALELSEKASDFILSGFSLISAMLFTIFSLLITND